MKKAVTSGNQDFYMFILEINFPGMNSNNSLFFKRDLLEIRQGKGLPYVFNGPYDSFGRRGCIDDNILPWKGMDKLLPSVWRLPTPNGPFDKYFPPDPSSTNKEKIKGLKRITRILDYILGKGELEDSVNSDKLEKAKKLISKLLEKITKGLNPGILEKMKKELGEAIEAAKEGDFEKLGEFAEKIKNLTGDLVEEDKPQKIVPLSLGHSEGMD